MGALCFRKTALDHPGGREDDRNVCSRIGNRKGNVSMFPQNALYHVKFFLPFPWQKCASGAPCAAEYTIVQSQVHLSLIFLKCFTFLIH